MVLRTSASGSVVVNMGSKKRFATSKHYRGEAGARYVEFKQSDPYHLGYKIDFAYFEPFLEPSDAVLDFGCGNGGMLRLLDACVHRAEGLEVNPHAAKIARDLGLTVYSALEELPQTAYYDAVVSNHVLEHVRDVPSTLERLRASMRRNGLLLLKLPLNDWRTAHQRAWSKHDVDHHLYTWTPRLIGNVLYEAGYEVEDIKVITSTWHPKLFPLVRLGLGSLAFWTLAVLKKRRQLFVVGRAP